MKWTRDLRLVSCFFPSVALHLPSKLLSRFDGYFVYYWRCVLVSSSQGSRTHWHKDCLQLDGGLRDSWCNGRTFLGPPDGFCVVWSKVLPSISLFISCLRDFPSFFAVLSFSFVFWESTCFRDFPLNAGNCSGRNFPSPSQIFRPYFRWGWWMGETLPSSSTISSLFRDFPLSGSRRSSKNPGINSGRNSVKKKEEKKIRVISRAVSEQSRIWNLKRAVTEQLPSNFSAFLEQFQSSFRAIKSLLSEKSRYRAISVQFRCSSQT